MKPGFTPTHAPRRTNGTLLAFRRVRAFKREMPRIESVTYNFIEIHGPTLWKRTSRAMRAAMPLVSSPICV